MSCEYGCPQQDIDKLCEDCKHPKQHHLSIHPHACMGEWETADPQSPRKQCFCNEFKSKKEERS